MQPAKASDSLPVFPDNRRRHQPIRLDPVRWQIEPRQSQTFICSEAFSLYLEGWRFAMLLDLLTHIYIHKHRITLTNSEIPNHLIGALVTNTQLFTHLWDNLICRASVFPACNLQLLWSVTYTEHLQMKLWLHPKNATFRGIPRWEGIEARPNPKLASLPVSWDTFIWSIFEGSIDESFAAFGIPQSCAFHYVMVELKNKDGVWKLRLVVSLCVNVYFGLTFSTFDVISSEKLGL